MAVRLLRGEMGGRWRRLAAAACGVLAGAAMFPSAEAAVVNEAEGFELSATVGLVRGPHTDPATERLVREVLRRGGVRHVVAAHGRDPGTDVTVWLGDGATGLDALDAPSAKGLAAEGYSLATGRMQNGRAHIVLNGVDGDGTFYAAQRLREAIVPLPGRDLVPAIRERTAPAMRFRGMIEGFYGTPWSQKERLDALDYLGAHRMNTYVYAPKDDPALRTNWRKPFGSGQLADLRALVQRARDNRVNLVFALSPGLSICYTSQPDFASLTAKLDSAYALGVRSFSVAFDDIDPNAWNCRGDRAKYGEQDGAEGRAQADLLNRVRREWARPKHVTDLQLVPTEYDNATPTPYKKAIRDHLDRSVAVNWTGVAVISHTITRAQAAHARKVFGHEIVVWDNYPANDYIAGRIPLGPYAGREPGLSSEVAGVLSNPMNQAALSKVALYSFAEFGWDDRAYDEQESWRRALAERTAGDKRAAWALASFADLNSFDGTLHYVRAPLLSSAVAEFWAGWDDGQVKEAATWLRPTLAALVDAPRFIRKGIDPAFAEEAKPWLDATRLWGQAMQAGLDTLVAVAGDDPGVAWTKAQQARLLAARAREVRGTMAPHDGVAPRVADGVADRFVNRAVRAAEKVVGVGAERPTLRTSLQTYADNEPARMLDGDEHTFFASDAPPRAGDFVQVDLRRVRPIGAVSVLMTYANAPKDFLASGVLEYSRDGRTCSSSPRATPPRSGPPRRRERSRGTCATARRATTGRTGSPCGSSG